jgi:hypothetical protein
MPGDIMQSTNKHKQAMASAAPPPDQEALRRDLTYKLVAFVNRRQWPACPRRLCRRLHGCVPTDFVCANPRPARVLTPEQQTASMAHLHRALARRAAALRGEAR